MTYIPSARKKYKDNLFGNTQGALDIKELNPYYEGFLDKDGKASISGYDWAVDEIENFFMTITDRIEFDDEVTEKSVRDFINSDKEIDEYDDFELAMYGASALAIKTVKEELFKHLESYRDETIVSLIENMDDDEYERIVGEVDG